MVEFLHAETYKLREEFAPVVHKLVAEGLPLTGRFNLSCSTSYSLGKAMNTKINLEVNDTSDARHEIFRSITFSEFIRDCIDKKSIFYLRYAISGFRCFNWFRPNPEYNGVVSLPLNCGKGIFDILSSSDGNWCAHQPRLTDKYQEEFNRLGLDDYLLGKDWAFDGTPQFIPYAFFKDEDQWMTAKLRFGRTAIPPR